MGKLLFFWCCSAICEEMKSKCRVDFLEDLKSFFADTKKSSQKSDLQGARRIEINMESSTLKSKQTKKDKETKNTATLSASSSVEQNEDSTDSFQQERQILLDSLTENLVNLISKMRKVNDNLKEMSNNSIQVGKVAEEWRSSFSEK